MGNAPPALTDALRDRYRLDRELGRGGMATVYLARDLRHDREVALKVLRPELATALGPERFLQEIGLTAQLQHPHILTLIDSGQSGGFLWYALPYVRGESLRSRLKREVQLPVSDALAIAQDIAAALEYAHQHGIIHRDVKPENILLQDGQAMLMDFGIALAIRDAGGERLTETGLSVGTPHYMSPEQATADRRLDARSDVYSLGVVLYEMLAGEPPFTGNTGQAVIARLMTQPPTPLRTLRERVPPHVDHAVSQALSKLPADRFPSAAAFAAALSGAGAVATAVPAPRATSRAWVMRVLAAGVLLAAIWGTTRALRSSPGRVELEDLRQRARQSYDHRTAAGTIAALNLYGAILGRDSSDADAWTGIAKTFVRAYIRYFPLPNIPRDSIVPLAVSAVDRALALDSSRAEAWVARAMVSRMVDPTDPRAPFRAVARALTLDSTSGSAWHQYAMTLAESGDFPAALAAWRQCVSRAPRYSEGLAFLAQADYWRGAYDSAHVWTDSAVAVEPGNVLGWILAGLVGVERKDYARAIAAFRAAARISPDLERVNALAGEALAEARAGHRAEAAELIRRTDSLAAAYHPAPPHTVFYVAAAYAALGNTDRAIGWLRRFANPADLHFQLHLRCDPVFAPLEGDARFRALLLPDLPTRQEGCRDHR